MRPARPAMALAPEDPADAGRQTCVLPHLIERKAAIMIDEIRQFVLDSLTDMNYSIDGIDDDTTLGPAGADLESLALAELAVRVEDRFGVKFDDDEGEMLAGMTVGEFCQTVEPRIQPASSAH